MTEVENMEKHILALKTFWELIAFIRGAIAAGPVDIRAFSDSGHLPDWITHYNLARKNPEVQTHIEELCDKRTDRP